MTSQHLALFIPKTQYFLGDWQHERTFPHLLANVLWIYELREYCSCVQTLGSVYGLKGRYLQEPRRQICWSMAKCLHWPLCGKADGVGPGGLASSLTETKFIQPDLKRREATLALHQGPSTKYKHIVLKCIRM